MKDTLKQIPIAEEIFELNECEKKIKEEIFIKNKNVKNFEKYALLNKKWLDEYKKYYNVENCLKTGEIKTPKNEENIFRIEELCPKYEMKQIIDDYKNEKIKVQVPINFILVSKKFIKLISKNIKNETPVNNSNNSNNNQIIEQLINNLFFDVIIGGKCIIIKEKENKNTYLITLYKESNEKDNNYNYNTDSINFILNYNNELLS